MHVCYVTIMRLERLAHSCLAFFEQNNKMLYFTSYVNVWLQLQSIQDILLSTRAWKDPCGSRIGWYLRFCVQKLYGALWYTSRSDAMKPGFHYRTGRPTKRFYIASSADQRCLSVCIPYVISIQFRSGPEKSIGLSAADILTYISGCRLFRPG